MNELQQAMMRARASKFGNDNGNGAASLASDLEQRVAALEARLAAIEQQKVPVPPPRTTIGLIKKLVCERYDISETEMESQLRAAPITHARQIAIYLVRTLTPASLPMIGMRFGDRDHTTILHAHHKIAQLRKTDAALNAELCDLEARLKGTTA